MKRYFYSNSISNFVCESTAQIRDIIVQSNQFELITNQKRAWNEEISILKSVLQNYEGQIFIEYSIPRMGKRIDVVLLIDGIVFVLEFKVGATNYLSSDIEQVWDYALDLKNFHAESHNLCIVPILIATEAHDIEIIPYLYEDKLLRPICSNERMLEYIIRQTLLIQEKQKIDNYMWGISRYAPTPTIIEAAKALYNQHSVENISRSDSTAKNLSKTCNYIFQVIENAKKENKKAICFVTGVPGAGKTLVGLNIATQKAGEDKSIPAVYLSGNGPLVKILIEALTRDKVKRIKDEQAEIVNKQDRKRITKAEVEREVKSFIQNVHHFRDNCLEGTIIENENIIPDIEYFKTEINRDKTYIPPEKIAIFDEAQRAWNKEMTAKFMKEKKSKPNFPYSEPEFLISCMDRHPDWAVIVCLVGGGQEINTGEAGISEWLRAIKGKYNDWQVYISSNLTDSEYSLGNSHELLSDLPNLCKDDSLHLSVSLRSFRAEKLSTFIHNLLDFELQASQELYKELTKYPIVVTRDLSKAKEWLKSKARGSERYGIVVSSQAHRLKPLAIDVRVQPNPINWFLDGKDDIRSSYFLEDVATEFDIQGLELDWSCVVWDGDFRYSKEGWKTYSFVGSKWQNINMDERKLYLKNAYRVLLTRARQGMVIVVPEGNPEDPTRKAEYYDCTFEYLKDIGIKVI
jgi:hypothetical protein